MGTVSVDRTKGDVSANRVVVADGVWKRNPSEPFGKKFGEKIPIETKLRKDRERNEFYVSFQPKKKFRYLAGKQIDVFQEPCVIL